MSYVRSGKLGRMRGLAGAHRVSGLGRAGRDMVQARMVAFAAPSGAIQKRLSALGYNYGTTALISQGIATTGAVVSKALTPTPTVLYNPTTGLYEATGGAALPASVTSSISLASLENYLPILLLAGGLVLIVSMVRK